MRKFLLMILLAAILLTITGCNTIEGMGEDISALGRGIADVFD